MPALELNLSDILVATLQVHIPMMHSKKPFQAEVEVYEESYCLAGHFVKAISLFIF